MANKNSIERVEVRFRGEETLTVSLRGFTATFDPGCSLMIPKSLIKEIKAVLGDKLSIPRQGKEVKIKEVKPD